VVGVATLEQNDHLQERANTHGVLSQINIAEVATLEQNDHLQERAPPQTLGLFVSLSLCLSARFSELRKAFVPTFSRNDLLCTTTLAP
jgi:hypothetical protein